jgi:hypothetical protein
MQKNNIEVAGWTEGTHSQPKRGATKDAVPTSKYKGVSWAGDRKKWHVQITKHGKRHTKYFGPDQEIEAAEYYNELARELYGEFAQLNDIPRKSPEEKP